MQHCFFFVKLFLDFLSPTGKTKVKAVVEELRQDYINNYGTKDEKYLKYLLGDISNAVKLDNGFIYEFRKRDIKKSFCFGHGFCGVSSEEETKNAIGMAEHARTSQEYFIQENLQDLNAEIEELREVLNNSDYLGYCVFKQNRGTKRCYIRQYGRRHLKEEIINFERCAEYISDLTNKSYIYHMMLNSIDYFDTAEGKMIHSLISVEESSRLFI